MKLFFLKKLLTPLMAFMLFVSSINIVFSEETEFEAFYDNKISVKDIEMYNLVPFTHEEREDRWIVPTLAFVGKAVAGGLLGYVGKKLGEWLFN